MIRIKWPVAIGILFLVLIGWYLFYTREIVLSLQENTTRLSEIYSKVQEGLIELLEGFEGTTFQIRLPAADA